MPANILNLPRLTVTQVDETDHDYHIKAQASFDPTACPECKYTGLVGFGRNEQLIKDLPMHGKRVGIYFDTRRFRCKECGKTFLEKHPDFHPERAMTARLVAWIGAQSIKRTFASLAEETGVVEGTIRNIFRDHVNELEATVRFETPQWMGIDEIHLIKPRCVITNIQNNTVIDMLANRNKDTVAKYLFQMKHRDKVQFVAMDMWTPYRDAVTAVMPQAKIVIDKFHVIKMANEAMEKARKGVRADLDLKQRRGLMHDRFVLLKRKNDLTDKEAFNLDGWTKNYPVLGEAYRLKESFYAVYEASTSKEEALARYEAWSKSVPPEIRLHFSDLIRAFTNWQPWILNYFDHKVTNAYTESLNSLIRVMDRMGRGYSFEALRAKILYTEGAHQKRSRPKFERMQPDIRFSMCVEESMPDDVIGLARWTPAQEPINQHKSIEETLNYGASISTLVELIEKGQI